MNIYIYRLVMAPYTDEHFKQQRIGLMNFDE